MRCSYFNPKFGSLCVPFNRITASPWLGESLGTLSTPEYEIVTHLAFFNPFCYALLVIPEKQ